MIPLYMCIYWYCQKKQWKDSKKVIKKSYLNRMGRGRNRSKSRCTTYVLHHFWFFNYMNSLPNFENKFNLKGNWSSKEKKKLIGCRSLLSPLLFIPNLSSSFSLSSYIISISLIILLPLLWITYKYFSVPLKTKPRTSDKL